MRSLPPSPRARRRSFLSSGGIALWNHFRPRLEILEDRRMLTCDMTVDLAGTLSVVGDEGDNRVELVGAEAVTPRGTERGVQVTCDGETRSFTGVSRVDVKAGDGDDQIAVDNSSGLLSAIAFQVFGQGGGDEFSMVLDDLLASAQSILAFYQGGLGTDSMLMTAGERADQFDILPVAQDEKTQIKVADIASQAPRAEVVTENVESLTFTSGGGDDIFDLAAPPLPGTEITLAAEDDEQQPQSHRLFRLFELLSKGDRSDGGLLGRIPGKINIQGATGTDDVVVFGDRNADLFDIGPGPQPGSIQIILSDAAGLAPVPILAEGIESLTTKAGDGDDEHLIQLIPALAQHHFGQGGDDTMLVAFSEDDNTYDMLSWDGGTGGNKVAVFGSDNSERYDISGVTDPTGPDPRIDITDLATGRLIARLDILNAEAIAVDSLGGDDQIVMRDDQGPLANVNWTLITGPGNDQIDAVLQSNPNEFFVEAGLGDDDVSIRFVGIPNLPEPDEPMPVIDVDMGAGVDGLLLDVFGSPTSPPVDTAAAGIAPSATLVEVLAAIFIQGVGLMSLLTLFPLGALEMRQAIQDDRAGHAKESSANVAMVLDGADLTADVKTGAADDQISIGLLPQADSHVDVHVAAGAGNDQIDVRSRSEAGPLDLHVVIEPGEIPALATEAEDQVLVNFQHGDVDRPIIIGTLWNSSSPPRNGKRTGGRLSLHAAAEAQTVRFDLDLLGTAAADVARVDASSSQESEGPTDTIIYVIDISGSLGGGDDSFTYAGLKGPPVRVGSWILDSTVDLDMGPGHDQVAVALETPAEEANQKVRIDTGDGADGVSVLLRRLANPHLPPANEPRSGLDELEIFTGAGNDAIDVRLESAAAALAQKVRIDSGVGDDRVSVDSQEAQRDGLADLIVGADGGAGPHVRVFDGGSSAEVQSFFAYDPSFSGGVRVAAGDVTGDGIADIITSAGPGAGPHVKVFDGASGTELRSFLAYDSGFSGGVYVAAGDVNGDGFADIVTGAGAAGGHVKAFDGRTGVEIRSFFAFDGFTGGVTVAAGDVNGDGRSDIIVGAGPGAAGGHVKVFDGRTGAEIRSFLTFPGFSGGVFVAAGDVDGDHIADIVTGADAGAFGGHVKVFSGASGAELRSFFAFDPNFGGGVRVAASDVNGDGQVDIIVGAGPGAPGGHVKVFDGRTGAEVRSFFAFDPSFSGGVFVAAADLHSSHRVKWFDEDLTINTSGGADTVAVQLAAAATEELVQKVRIATGDGADRASVIWSKLQLSSEFPSVAADLDIDMGSGNDAAEVEVQRDDRLLSDVVSFEVQLGAGNDLAKYWIFGTELPPAAAPQPTSRSTGTFAFQVLGGLGSDDIAGRIGSDRTGRLLPVALGQTHFHIDGGGGNDRIGLDFRDTIFDDESVEAILHGGGGTDQVRARFELGPASTGMLTAQVFGDAGNDDLGLAIFGDEQLEDFAALLDGGKGRDKCRATRNVTVVRCEL